ncbi:undecaprenyl-diphosphate phosphatase [Nodosilinea sp. E11]|uniref:undecaprenyl-diphosphate phosphatase n=1 Tax=Nodosilinea sp. E11 TaxID=3037479 RepID=UPI0039779AFF
MNVVNFLPWLAQASSPDDGMLTDMSLWQAIVIGVVQGFTEFLPISSTAHVKIVPVMLGWGDPGVAFTAVIQLGSIAAILWYFWADLVQVTTGMVKAVGDRNFDAPDFRLGMGILVGTLPLIVGGIFVKVFIPDFDNSFLRGSATIAMVSILMAGLLGVAETFGKRIRTFESLKFYDGIGMGFGQALAIIPGVSRAGSTLTAGLFMGLERATAARFSFLMGIPAIVLAGLVEVRNFFDAGTASVSLMPLTVGLIATVISSYVSIVWLLGFLKHHTTWVFVWYRLAFGVAILAAIAMGHTPSL